mmetsp:Transcript_43983/g.99868  ORF Transcript_43983/g.99868 Transcript_43983/m.99868 type:complete len:211 (+) Transcript_43983:488-1120(+)
MAFPGGLHLLLVRRRLHWRRRLPRHRPPGCLGDRGRFHAEGLRREEWDGGLEIHRFRLGQGRGHGRCSGRPRPRRRPGARSHWWRLRWWICGQNSVLHPGPSRCRHHDALHHLRHGGAVCGLPPLPADAGGDRPGAHRHRLLRHHPADRAGELHRDHHLEPPLPASPRRDHARGWHRPAGAGVRGAGPPGGRDLDRPNGRSEQPGERPGR